MMKFVVYGDRRRLGALAGTAVYDVEAAVRDVLARRRGVAAGAAEAAASPDLLAFIGQGPDALDLAREAVSEAERRGDRPLTSVRLHAPWPGRRVICGGANHPVHMARALTLMGAPTTPEAYARDMRRNGPRGFFKAIDRAVPPEGVVRVPDDEALFDYEGELALVIGRAGKNIPAQAYRPYVWGLTLICDWGTRDMAWPPAADPFNSSKNFDDSVSIGPCIVVDEGLDPDAQHIQTHVNGELRQDFSTAEFSLTFGETLAGLTRRLSLAPGDLVSAGSGPGTAMDTAERAPDGTWSRARFLAPGDRVEVSCPPIGALAATIAAYDPGPSSE